MTNINKGNFCKYPFSSVCITADSLAIPCCHIDAKDYNKNWKLSPGVSIEDHFYDKNFRNLRNDLLEGKKPKLCKKCWRLEDAGLQSPRMIINKQNVLRDIDIKSPKIFFVDVKFDNLCNLQCRMCSGINSSQISKMVFKHPELKEIFSITSQNFLQKEKEEWVKGLIDKGLNYLKVTGGEPLLSQTFLNVIDYAIKTKKAKNIILYITTNATKFNTSIFQSLSKFKELNFILSIDGTQKIYEYIRHPMKWDNLLDSLDNFLLFKEKNKVKVNIRCSCVVSVYNILGLKDLETWWKKTFYNYPIDFDISLKPADSYLDVKFLPKNIKKLAIDQNIDIVSKYLNLHLDLQNKDKNLLLKKNILQIDKIYNKKYQDYLPEAISNFLMQ